MTKAFVNNINVPNDHYNVYKFLYTYKHSFQQKHDHDKKNKHRLHLCILTKSN